ncbi:MAG TPA: exodeoxyribonuclease III [Thermoanaerobaculia bacterium]|nr:exodeoxyribonuclease III [Thermoanaerobaculia bacterium]
MTLTVATWNVNGIRAREQQFREWVGRERPDVVCLQEIKAAPEQLSEELCALDGYHCYWHGAGGYSGVALHVRRELHPEPPRFDHPAFDHETRIVSAELTVPGFGEVTAASIYVPNGGKDFQAKLGFLAALRSFAAELAGRGRQAILCGDLNVTRTDADIHPKERKKKPQIGTLPEERELLEGVIGTGLVDVCRELHPEADDLFTWWAPWRNLRQRNIGWRIDYILASEPLARRAAACEVGREVGTSDHGPVVARFAP